MEPICLSDLSYAVPGKTLLQGLTVTLSGRRVGLIGRNGSGKTTLLRLIAGLVAPSSGRLRIGATDPFTDRKAALAKIGILFQNPDHQILFPTVEEELAFGLTQMGHPQHAALARARDALAAHGRADWAKAAVWTLSHGQKQWLCLQAILLMQPETLLLDEPFAALDLPTEIRLRRHLDALPQRLITIAHRPDDLIGCDEVLWLDQGRVQGFGPPDQVLPAFSAEMARLGAEDMGAADEP
ncbi:energy-coupling factor ABC transporter ATP-binding protein [Tabrizicola oligotrophica]|uniref:ABC transporter ATP-binding protein n=1 Tax=Tabrizicola oligotrophica TaxID=2710650 RepID=A0A6M0QVL9_9RHOB|nr:ABC transporter ATP-binding protein [Tabrizicola oligotrophica]NEY91470.1 ABC transporter ATP-binding protein [Tabrizicola oligotrophica]